jgi:ribosome modulation factor
MSSPERRKKIQELREAGAAAFAAGKHIQTCPEKFMDRFQWEAGWLDAQWDASLKEGT